MTERNQDAGQGDESEPALPADEEAAWAAIVAAYGEEPDDDPGGSRAGHDGTGGGREHDTDGVRDGDAAGSAARGGGADGPGDSGGAGGDAGGVPVRSFTVFSAGEGPRDWRPPEEAEGGEEEDDEGHFVPPEPPPLPEADTTTKFAWFAALGGPLLLLGAVILRADMTWWIVTLGVGGFLGGFATLVARMRDGRDDEDYDDPGSGAVV